MQQINWKSNEYSCYTKINGYFVKVYPHYNDAINEYWCVGRIYKLYLGFITGTVELRKFELRRFDLPENWQVMEDTIIKLTQSNLSKPKDKGMEKFEEMVKQPR